MEYRLEYKPQAVRDLRALDRQVRSRVQEKIEAMAHDLAGDVKRLTNFEPQYRLRVGDWRVLFAIGGDSLVIYRVVRRDQAYDR
jgi:mRNA interferase RelE/StbE